jgi:hypothetical protein
LFGTPFLFVTVLTVAGCHVAEARPPTLEDLGKKCHVASAPNPMLVKWKDSNERAALDALAQQKKLLVVRYVGCDLELLKTCRVHRHSPYRYTGISAKHEEESFRTADRLYASMPFAAGQFEAKLQSSGAIVVITEVVGRFETDADGFRSNELHGEQGACDGATHVVKAFTVGAYEVRSEAAAQVSAGVAVQGVGVGGAHATERGSLDRDGDFAACKEASSRSQFPPERCSAPQATTGFASIPVESAGSCWTHGPDIIGNAGCLLSVSTWSRPRATVAASTLVDTRTGGYRRKGSS